MVVARRLVHKPSWHGRDTLYRALALIWVTVAWLPAVLIEILQDIRLRGADVVPIVRIPSAIWAAIRHNVLPTEYFSYALWRPGRKENIDHYLYSNEASRLFKLINQPSVGDPITDKLAFYELCRRRGIPTPPILAAFGPSARVLEFESGLPPPRDLFVKPSCSFAGDGCERFRWQGNFKNDRGGHMTPTELDRHLTTRATNEQRTLLVQPLLSNHPSLGLERNAALVTLRLVTGLSPNEDVIPIYGFVYFTRSEAQTGRQATYTALVDSANGKLISVPRDLSDAQGRNSIFQITWNAAMLNWPSVLDHVKRAHRACSSFVFVGWDIAFTSRGPVLLEGNANWMAAEYQLLSGEPLGHTRFADVLEARLKSLYARHRSFSSSRSRLGSGVS